MVTELKEQAPQTLSAQTADIVVLGGTLGIFMAAALQLQGKNVIVIERGQVQGRDQEWNISRAEMQVCALACACLMLQKGTHVGNAHLCIVSMLPLCTTLVESTTGQWSRFSYQEFLSWAVSQCDP